MGQVVFPGMHQAHLLDFFRLQGDLGADAIGVADRAFQPQSDTAESIVGPTVHPDANNVVANVVDHEVHPSVFVKVGCGDDM